MITRRGLLAGILGACAAPAIVHNPMRIWVPRADEAWGIRYLDLNGDFQRLQDAMNEARRQMVELTACPPMIIGQIDRFTFYESPALPADTWRVVQPVPRPAIKRPHRRW